MKSIQGSDVLADPEAEALDIANDGTRAVATATEEQIMTNAQNTKKTRKISSQIDAPVGGVPHQPVGRRLTPWSTA